MKNNKHVMVAMIVAPILAIISYFATDYIVSEEPIVAQKGQQYALLARPNCRYESGQCTLINGDLEITLRRMIDSDGQAHLQAKASRSLDGVKVAFVESQVAVDSTIPNDMLNAAKDGTSWSLPLLQEHRGSELQLVTQAQQSVFYASTETVFFDYDTGFPRKDW